METFPNPFEASKKPASKADYYHDNRGEYHEADRLIVPMYSEEMTKLIRDEYLEGHEDTSEEISRLQKLLPVIKNDPKALELLGSLISNCAGYFERVVGHNIARTQTGRKETKTFQEDVVESDKLRRLKHNALMSDMRILRDYVMKHYGPEGDLRAHNEDELPSTLLYTGKEADRTSIGYWALRLTEALARLPDDQREALLEPVQKAREERNRAA